MKNNTATTVGRGHRDGGRQGHRQAGSGNRARKPLIAAAVALGVGMAATGTTYALWHASTIIGGGSITAGNLALTPSRAPAYWDVSADRTDATEHINPLPGSPLGQSVDLAKWRMVPGDKIALTQKVKVQLEGDNLTAALAVSGIDQAKNLPLKWTYTINNAATGDAIASGAIPASPPSVELAYFTATPASQTPGGNPELWPVTDGETDLEVVIYAELPDTVSGTDYTRVNQALANVKLDLNQVRNLGN